MLVVKWEKGGLPLYLASHYVAHLLLSSFLGTNVVSFSVFWLFSALYLLVDLTGRPKWALQFKIQDGSNQPVSHSSFLVDFQLTI